MLIFLVQWLFLGDLRSAAHRLGAPFLSRCLFAVTILMLRGESANLLSVGAIDFGLIVDATVIMVENIFRHLTGEVSARGEREKRRAEATAAGLHGKLATILVAAAAKWAGRSSSPPRSSSRPSCRCSPCRASKATSSVRWRAPMPMRSPAVLIATFTVTPALSAFLLPAQMQRDRNVGRALAAPPSMCRCPDLRSPTALWRWAVRVCCLLSLVLAVRLLGIEFLPHLEEGNLWIRATMPAAISLEDGNGYVNQMRS